MLEKGATNALLVFKTRTVVYSKESDRWGISFKPTRQIFVRTPTLPSDFGTYKWTKT